MTNSPRRRPQPCRVIQPQEADLLMQGHRRVRATGITRAAFPLLFVFAFTVLCARTFAQTIPITARSENVGDERIGALLIGGKVALRLHTSNAGDGPIQP